MVYEMLMQCSGSNFGFVKVSAIKRVLQLGMKGKFFFYCLQFRPISTILSRKFQQKLVGSQVS